MADYLDTCIQMGLLFFFICVYAHVFRNIYYLSFLRPRQWVWYSGVVILILMIATAFTGYVLPWGQMSYWAATVITNLFSVIPYCGNDVVVWLWGDYGVTTSTLNRFYTIHFILPFIILIVACLHIFVLHRRGSTSKLGIVIENGKIMFHPFFTFKDFVFLTIVFMIFLSIIGFAPNYLGHPDNYIPADPLVTPSHIVPEWYFLPFYAMLRCVPNKSLGVIVLACSLLQLFLLPALYPNANLMNSKIVVRETLFNKNRNYFYTTRDKDDETARIIFFGFKFYIVLFWLFLIDCILLGVLGAKSLETPYVGVSLFCTIFYFLFFYIGSFIFSEKGQKLLSFFLLLPEIVLKLLEESKQRFNYFINGFKKILNNKKSLKSKILDILSLVKESFSSTFFENDLFNNYIDSSKKLKEEEQTDKNK